MADRATSDDPQVQAQLDRLNAMSPGKDLLGLERLRGLLARLGHPERALPPVIHIAGTNGKGSTCAILRAAVEAQGLSAHVYTSPHLVRFNERIRVAGRLVDDAMLADLLSDTLDAADGEEITFFEATTAAAFLGFARVPADVAIVEVGLGGRLDATNIIAAPLICAIAQLGMDHREFLGDTPEQIAAEKAGIAKPDVPLVTLRYPAAGAARVGAVAAERGAPVIAQGEAWDARIEEGRLRYRDAAGALDLPAPSLPGAHQADNAGLAIALLRHQARLMIGESALARAMVEVRWPARLQTLGPGPLTALAPAAKVILDGGHNPDAARAIAATLGNRAPITLIMGLLDNRDVRDFLAPLAPLVGALRAVPVPGHDHHKPDAICAIAREMGIPRTSAAADVAEALAGLDTNTGAVLIAGSLYLAGSVLALNQEAPD